MIQDETLARQLSTVLGGVRVESLERLSGGASRETWQLSAGGDDLVLQRLRRGAVTRLDGEIAVLRLAGQHGVPVPEVVVDGSTSSTLERPFVIVRKIGGESIARKILRDDRYAAARTRLPADLARAAAKIHSLPLSTLTAMADTDQLAAMYGLLDALRDPHPAFEIGLRWLELNRPSPRQTVLVHGDLRLGNLLVNDVGLTGVLDWELSHLGSPTEDLGWMCVRAWRFGSPLAAAGVCNRKDLLRHYEAAGGANISTDELRWWEVLGTIKWGLICIMQSQTHLSGLVNSHELAILGRRVSENEWDVLNLLTAATV